MDGAQDLCWQVLLFLKELASSTSLHEVFSISYGSEPIESRSIRFTDQIGGCHVLTVNICIKVRLDLKADKSPFVVKGPSFPRVVNPRYRIRGTNV
jgi:hypothetical protein